MPLVDVTFSIIVPTSGRPTLRHAFESIASQFEPGDEVIVVYDRSDDWGDAARNGAIARAKGTHLVFMDDDDEFLPGALDTMRRFARQHPDRVGIFCQRRVLYGHAGAVRTVTGSRADDLYRTASPMYCVPNKPGQVGRFRAPAENGRKGDVGFIRETVELQGEPVWRDEVTYVVRPERSRWRRLRYRLALRTRLRRLGRRG
jgi:glycosyltransferase involved in cell wall biosynthesis